MNARRTPDEHPTIARRTPDERPTNAPGFGSLEPPTGSSSGGDGDWVTNCVLSLSPAPLHHEGLVPYSLVNGGHPDKRPGLRVRKFGTQTKSVNTLGFPRTWRGPRGRGRAPPPRTAAASQSPGGHLPDQRGNYILCTPPRGTNTYSLVSGGHPDAATLVGWLGA